MTLPPRERLRIHPARPSRRSLAAVIDGFWMRHTVSERSRFSRWLRLSDCTLSIRRSGQFHALAMRVALPYLAGRQLIERQRVARPVRVLQCQRPHRSPDGPAPVETLNYTVSTTALARNTDRTIVRVFRRGDPSESVYSTSIRRFVQTLASPKLPYIISTSSVVITSASDTTRKPGHFRSN